MKEKGSKESVKGKGKGKREKGKERVKGNKGHRIPRVCGFSSVFKISIFSLVNRIGSIRDIKSGYPTVLSSLVA